MDASYHYNYDDGISYPHHVGRGYEGHILAQPLDQPVNELHSRDLLNFCKANDANIERLKSMLVQVDPCYQFGSEHWHENCTRKNKFQAWAEDGYVSHGQPQNMSSNGVFTADKHIAWKKPHAENSEETKADTNNTCYLCSTLDEHRQHMARRGPQLKAKPKPKRRVVYTPPPPSGKVKRDKVEKEEKLEVLYKVSVKTAPRPDAGTSANVYIKLIGSRGQMKKRPLIKNRAARFTFGSGTTEMFYLKGPKIGDLTWVTLSHDGVEKKHSWFVDEVEVENMSTGQIWGFVCKKWLSIFKGDLSTSKDIKAEPREVQEVEYEVTVVTGDKRHADTDANVFVTLHGRKGVSPRMPLKIKDAFLRGQKDKFNVLIKDVGKISYIKIEHDNTGPSPDWFLEQVLLREADDSRMSYTFPCGQWLAEGEEEGGTARLLYPVGRNGKGLNKHNGRSRDSESTSFDQIMYEFSFETGTRNYAGTDASVHVIMVGKLGCAREVQFKDTNGKMFEKGNTDVFKIQADDVGDLKRIDIRHDNKGMAAGWFLEQAVVKRYFSRHEVVERMAGSQAKLERTVERRASEIAGTHIQVTSRPTSAKHRGSIRSGDRDGDEDGGRGGGREGRPSSGRGRRSLSRELELERIAEEEEEDGGRRKGRGSRRGDRAKGRGGRSGGGGSKKLEYQGMVVYVTDSEAHSDESETARGSPDRRRGGRRRPKHGGHSDDSDSGEDRALRRRGGTGKARRQDNRRRGDSDGDSDDLSPRGRRQRKTGRHGNSEDDDDDENDSDDGKRVWHKDRVPHYDQYVFPCRQWLAEDEADGLISRTLKPKSVTTFYKVKK